MKSNQFADDVHQSTRNSREISNLTLVFLSPTLANNQ